MSDLVEELLTSKRYNSRTRPASDRGRYTSVLAWLNYSICSKKFKDTYETWNQSDLRQHSRFSLDLSVYQEATAQL